MTDVEVWQRLQLIKDVLIAAQTQLHNAMVMLERLAQEVNVPK